MVRTKIDTRKLSFDALEERTLLSGNCTAAVTRAGDLAINCDNEANSLTVEGYGDYIEIEGHDETTINGQESVEFPGFSRDLKINTRGGIDYVYLYDLDVARNLNVNGGSDADYLGGREATTVGGNERLRGVEDEGGQPTNVMQIKLNQAINQLQRANLPEQAYLDAINQGMEAIYTSNLVVLPTPQTPEIPGDTGADPEFQEHQNMAQQLIDALNRFIQGTDAQNRPIRGLGTPGSQHMAFEARNFIQITNEAMGVIGGQTDFCNPQNPDPATGGAGCQFLQADDEGGNFTVDNVLAGIFSRQVRSPFPFILASSSLTPDEQVILTDPIGDGECAAVVKEIQGIKVVVTPRRIPIWVEPWFARARIVGFKTVWVWEFVPAEFIKTIGVCNNGGSLNVEVTSAVVLDRQLLHFWRFLHKDVTAVS
jgi:hypothetical protein